MNDALSSLLDLLATLPGAWILAAVFIVFMLSQWKRWLAGLVGLLLCPLFALWGHGLYLRRMQVELAGVLPLTETGFYMIVGLLALYYGGATERLRSIDVALDEPAPVLVLGDQDPRAAAAQHPVASLQRRRRPPTPR